MTRDECSSMCTKNLRLQLDLRRSPNFALTSSGVRGPISIGLGSPTTGVFATLPLLTALFEPAATSSSPAALMCKLRRPIIDLDRDDVKDMADGVVKASTADEVERTATVAATGSRAVIESFIIAFSRI